MKFTKMHGLGNDYIYVDCTRQRLADPVRLAQVLSDRHFGVGSDGLICICPSDQGDFRMEMYNADGSIGEMCGNGIRCVGKYVYEHGLTRKEELTIETGAGLRKLFLLPENGHVDQVRVDMGKPITAAKEIPLATDRPDYLEQILEAAGKRWQVSCVSMGNPHCVVWVEDPDAIPLETVGPVLEHHPLFPAKANIEFVHAESRERIKMRVWERGSGETMACGTGACATLAAGVLGGRTGRQASVVLRGGELEILWSEEDGHIYMTGPAVEVFEGNTLLD